MRIRFDTGKRQLGNALLASPGLFTYFGVKKASQNKSIKNLKQKIKQLHVQNSY